jgi:gliding motility-associated-like protein
LNQTSCDTYTWLVNNQTYTTSGTYSDVSTNAAGCTHTEILDLVVGYSAEIDLLIDENNISCFGYNDGTIILNPNGGTPPYQYLWGNGSINQSLISLFTGTYSFTITDDNGCTIDSVATVNEPNQISLDFIATSPICRYDESVLSINISNSTSNVYTVSLQDSILKSFIIDTNGLLIPEGVAIILTPNYSGEAIIISLTDNNGCTEILNDNVHIEVKQLPELYLNEEGVCVGQASYTLNQATPTGGTYFINNEMTNYFDVENLETGGYNIGYEYTDPITLCFNEIEEIITINKSPEAGLFFSPQPTDINDPDIFFRDNSNDLLTSVWNLGDGTIIYDDLNFWHTYSDTGTYIIRYYITNQYNCTDSVIETLVINPVYNTFIPLAFTPNDDGDNDYFYPSIIGGNNYNMKIYDRWGGIIYNEDNGKWNGTMNNDFIISGLYSYSITVFDFKDKPFIYTGLVTLIK